MATFVRTESIDHAIGAGGRLGLRVPASDVRLRGATGAEARVRATYEIRAASEGEADRIFEAARLSVARADGELSLEAPRDTATVTDVIGRLFRGRGEVELALEAEVPAGAELRIETVSGDINADGTLGSQRYTTVSGDVFVREAGGTLRVNTVSGDVTVRADTPLSVRVETVSGDVSVAAPRIDGLRGQAVSGDIEVEGRLAEHGDFRVETVSGDLVVGLAGAATFEVRGLSTDVSAEIDHRIEGRHDRRRVVIGDGTPSFLFSSMSGDLAIHRPRRISVAAVDSSPEGAMPALDAGDQLDVLEALERGEIDVDEAARRLGQMGSTDA